MGLFTKFLNPNAMNDAKVIEMANIIVKEECVSEIQNVIRGVIDLEFYRKDFRNTENPKKYTVYMDKTQNQLDSDFERLQARANYFSNAFIHDLRVVSKSHPIIRLYILIISFNTCFKNYIWYEYEVINSIYSGKSEDAITNEVIELRNKSKYYSNHMDKMLNQILEISDSPEKVLRLQEMKI